MDRVLIILLVVGLINTAENFNVGVLLSPTTEEDINLNGQKAKLCQLPPYPKHGGYVVLNAMDATPGDVFSNVSLVQYTTDTNKEVFEIKRFTCSFGDWEQDIFEYDGKALYFYTRWCPYFCSSFLSEQWTECSPPNIKENQYGVQQNRSSFITHRRKSKHMTSQFCRLPPYPSHGTYVVQNQPDAAPGDSFQEVSLIQYTSDESNMVVTIKHFRCSSGVWYQKIFQEASETLYFYSSWCPSLCSQCFGEKLADSPHSMLLKNEALTRKDQSRTRATSCTVPPRLKFGNYSLISESKVAQPGDVFDALRLNYTCDTGYTLVGHGNVNCLKGVWSADLPKCTKFCNLVRQPGVEYSCGEADARAGVRLCGAHAQDGSTVIPRCSSPYYQSRSPLKLMTCVDGEWDNIPECLPVCGLRVQAEDRSAADARLKAPWNVAIFHTRQTPYKIICGGSIVARNLIISAAECFFDYDVPVESPVYYLVIAGKLYRSLYQPNDDKAQQSKVAKIKLPLRYIASSNKFHHDIAVAFLTTPFVYNEYVWPICLNFDEDLDERQLTEGRVGIIAGWGQRFKESSEVLKIVELPYVDFHQCIIKATNNTWIYGGVEEIATDKICAGYDTGTPLCYEERGAGFAVAETDPSDPRKHYYFLRGLVSARFSSICEDKFFSIFTKISAHQDFILDNSAGVIF